MSIRALQKDLSLLSHVSRAMSLTVPSDVTKKDLTSSGFWDLTASSLEEGVEIRVVPDDYSWVARCIVRHKTGTDLMVGLESFVSFTGKPKSETMSMDGYEIKMRGTHKWCVVKQSDGTVIKSGIADRIAALSELSDHVKALSL